MLKPGETIALSRQFMRDCLELGPDALFIGSQLALYHAETEKPAPLADLAKDPRITEDQARDGLRQLIEAGYVTEAPKDVFTLDIEHFCIMDEDPNPEPIVLRGPIADELAALLDEADAEPRSPEA